jgi:hypothetical protein
MNCPMAFFAQILNPNDVDLPNKNADIGDAITNGLRIVFGVAGAIAFLMVTIAGFKYVISQGNPQETAKAKDALIHAIIGLFVALSAFAIVQFVIGSI